MFLCDIWARVVRTYMRVCLAYFCVKQTHEKKMDTYLEKKKQNRKRLQVYVAKNRAYKWPTTQKHSWSYEKRRVLLTVILTKITFFYIEGSTRTSSLSDADERLMKNREFCLWFSHFRMEISSLLFIISRFSRLQSWVLQLQVLIIQANHRDIVAPLATEWRNQMPWLPKIWSQSHWLLFTNYIDTLSSKQTMRIEKVANSSRIDAIANSPHLSKSLCSKENYSL